MLLMFCLVEYHTNWDVTIQCKKKQNRSWSLDNNLWRTNIYLWSYTDGRYLCHHLWLYAPSFDLLDCTFSGCMWWFYWPTQSKMLQIYRGLFKCLTECEFFLSSIENFGLYLFFLPTDNLWFLCPILWPMGLVGCSNTLLTPVITVEGIDTGHAHTLPGLVTEQRSHSGLY